MRESRLTNWITPMRTPRYAGAGKQPGFSLGVRRRSTSRMRARPSWNLSAQACACRTPGRRPPRKRTTDPGTGSSLLDLKILTTRRNPTHRGKSPVAAAAHRSPTGIFSRNPGNPSPPKIRTRIPPWRIRRPTKPCSCWARTWIPWWRRPDRTASATSNTRTSHPPSAIP